MNRKNDTAIRKGHSVMLFVSLCCFFLMLHSLPCAARPSSADTLKWYERVQQLDGITVRSAGSRYSRRGNPAVALMRKVIAARRRNDLSAHDYYRYGKYQKLTMAVNDIGQADLERGILAKLPGVYRQIELCPYNNKLILPAVMTESVTQEVYRKNPADRKTIVVGERSDGINKIFQSGELIVATLKDFFPAVDIYDDRIRMLQHRFTSPIGSDAIRFYRFSIADTMQVGGDRCIRLRFTPENPQDFGFSGELYVMDDTSYQVRRCELAIPRRSDINFVDGMRIFQEWVRTPGGDWVQTVDDMVADLSLFDFMQKCIIVRTTRMYGHEFTELPDVLFRGPAAEVNGRGYDRRDEGFWMVNRRVDLTPGERNLPGFVRGVKLAGQNKVLVRLMKAAVENYMETGAGGHPSLFDIGPVYSILSNNSFDGLRTRIGGQSTAYLNPHVFFRGYYARGWESRENYYSGELTYSFCRRDYMPYEKPLRNITFSSAYDICAPSDRGKGSDGGNMLTALRWTADDRLMTYNRQQLRIEREEKWGLTSSLALTAEENIPRGSLTFTPEAPRLRTTELKAMLRFAPEEKFVATKRGRRMINRETSVLTLSHAIGIDGFLGGDYRYNITEATLYRRFWMKSWGKIDTRLTAAAQWNSVPFPLLVMPSANLSYVMRDGTFNLMNSMEFLTDRYIAADISWDMNGKLLNRIPLVRRLKWRERIGIKAMWGDLTDKNNPAAGSEAAGSVLMPFPEGSYIMDGGKPYVEMAVGVHNIFRFFDVEYVRRLTYTGLPGVRKDGVRFRLQLQF